MCIRYQYRKIPFIEFTSAKLYNDMHKIIVDSYQLLTIRYIHVNHTLFHKANAAITISKYSLYVYILTLYVCNFVAHFNKYKFAAAAGENINRPSAISASVILHSSGWSGYFCCRDYQQFIVGYWRASSKYFMYSHYTRRLVCLLVGTTSYSERDKSILKDLLKVRKTLGKLPSCHIWHIVYLHIA